MMKGFQQVAEDIMNKPTHDRFNEVATYMPHNMKVILTIFIVASITAVAVCMVSAVRMAKAKRHDGNWKRFIFPVSYFGVLALALTAFTAVAYGTGSFYKTKFTGQFAVADVQKHFNPHKQTLVVQTQNGRQHFTVDKKEHVRKGDALVAEINAPNRFAQPEKLSLKGVSNYHINRLERGGG